MKTTTSLSQLKEDIHAVLKTWYEATPDGPTLDYLQLQRQARLKNGGDERRATRQILLDALDALAVDHEESARLLRYHFLDGLLMQNIANRLNIAQSTAYRRQQEALHLLAHIIRTREETARNSYQTSLEKQLRLPPETHLFGIDSKLNTLLGEVLAAEAPWLLSIEGLGGLGKTALANALIRHPELSSRFEAIAWQSAKQRDFLPGLGLTETETPALTVDNLIDALLEQFDQSALLTRPPQEKKSALIRLVKQTPYLIVIDNLETLIDYQTLLPLLRDLVNPSKILLTSRHTLRTHPDVFCLSLTALEQSEAFALIRYEARTRGLTMLAEADPGHLQRIYDVVGGHPLALKLIVGQTAILPLSRVLEGLQAAEGQPTADLYSHIYWQAWQLLTDAARQTLLVMPLAQEGSLEHLQTLSRLEDADLYQAIHHLVTLSLLQIEGELDERRYTIHRLTETFLLNEAITWGSSN